MSAQSATILDFASDEAVERAWDDLRGHRARIVSDTSLLLDRAWTEEDVRLYSRFQRLFNATGAGR